MPASCSRVVLKVICRNLTPPPWCPSPAEVFSTDGPFGESEEHLAGFYVIEAEDLDAALAWASRTTAAVGRPIEVRPFREAEA
jgi:hypothetical protein